MYVCILGDMAVNSEAGMLIFFRNSLYLMIWTLIKCGNSKAEIEPLLAFMDKCKDEAMLNEISQLLLCLLVDGKMPFTVILADASNGAEGFASFVLFRLITNPHESVRANGIRLLTHFYASYNALPEMKSSQRVAFLAQNAFLTVSLDFQDVNCGLELFRQLGGLSLLRQMLANYVSSSSYSTYSALLEMLLSRSFGQQPETVAIEYEFILQTSFHRDAEGDGNNAIEFKKNALHSGRCVFSVVPFQLYPEMLSDLTEAGIATSMLSIFFPVCNSLQSLDMSQLLNDVLAIVKYCPLNRAEFTQQFDWPSYFLDYSTSLLREEMPPPRLADDDFLLLLLSQVDCHDKGLFQETSTKNCSLSCLKALPTRQGFPQSIHTAEDSNFSMSMKIFSTILLYDLENTQGSRELERLLGVYAVNSKDAFTVCCAIVNNTLFELIAEVLRKHQNLLRDTYVFAFIESSAKKILLENIVCGIITIAQFIARDVYGSGDICTEMKSTWSSLSKTQLDLSALKELVGGDDDVVTLLRSLHTLEMVRLEEFRGDQVPYFALEKSAGKDIGRVMMVLQALQLFDSVFRKPTDALRGSQFLRYTKEKRIAGSSSPDQQPSLLESLLVMGIFVLQEVSPYSPLALTNLQRLTDVLRAADVGLLKGSVDLLLTALLTECIKTLLRIRSAIQPMYVYLGFGLPIDILATPAEDGVDEDQYLAVLGTDDIIFQRIYNEDGVVSVMETIFECAAGVQLQLYIIQIYSLICLLWVRKETHLLANIPQRLVFFFKSFCSRARADVPSLKEKLVLKKHMSDRMDDFFSAPLSDVTSVRTPQSYSVRERVSRSASSTKLSDSFTGANALGSDTDVTPMPGSSGTVLHISDIIAVLSCLRDPFISASAVTLTANLRHYNTAPFWSILQEDVVPLKSAAGLAKGEGLVLGKMPTFSSVNREKVSEEITFAKNAAHNWRTCLSRFEVEWSPWFFARGQGGKIVYELGRHRDCSQRRNVLFKSLDVVDYSGAAYYGARRTQSTSMMGKRKGSLLASNNFYSDRAPKRFIRRNLSGWGDETALLLDMPPGLMAPLLLSDKKPQLSLGFDWTSDERAVYSADATLVELERSINGAVHLTNKFLYFHPRKVIEKSVLSPRSRPIKTRRWLLESLFAAHARRYLLKNCGIELTFSQSLDVFLAFGSLKELQTFFYILRRQNVPCLTTSASLSPKKVCSEAKWTELWRKRIISNFEYITQLNMMAGRSYSDISQYPVFPWVIADYTSSTLDLKNPSTFRDLSRPVGALDPSKHDEIMERYNNSFENVDVPKFMYGSHYSSPGVVLHYLIRQEPFTTMAVEFQGGKFDCPDRLFFDVGRTWDGLHNSQSDVKELIPEFFCCPEMFINTNSLPLGELQTGVEVNDVILPPWAKDAFDFVRINREALESDYVSENLCHWIDLIFGYKQTGEAAVDARNVFSYLTYENAIDIDTIADAMEREATIATVVNFGQTPSQLFDKPHVRRLQRSECEPAVCVDKESVGKLVIFTLPGQSQGALTCVRSFQDRVVAFYEDLTVCYSKWSNFGDVRSKKLPCASLSINGSLNLSRKKSTLLVDISSTRIASCGYWDNSIRVHALDTLREVASTTSGHVGAITCIQMDKVNHHTLVTGGVDGTCRVWLLENSSAVHTFFENAPQKDLYNMPLFCVHVLCGHHSPVSAISFSIDLDMVFSASSDGSLCLHTVRSGEFVRMISMPCGLPVDVVYIAPQGYLISHSWNDLKVNLFWINGPKLCSVRVSAKIECFISNSQSDVLVCGATDCSLSFLKLSDLSLLNSIDISDCGGVKCLWFTEGIFLLTI